MRARVELALALVAAAGCVLSWLGARDTVSVAPVLFVEPQAASGI